MLQQFSREGLQSLTNQWLAHVLEIHYSVPHFFITSVEIIWTRITLYHNLALYMCTWSQLPTDFEGSILGIQEVKWLWELRIENPVDYGPIWDGVCDAFQWKKQKNPAKRSAVDARCTAALNARREAAKWTGAAKNARSEGRAAFDLFATRFPRPRSQTGPMDSRFWIMGVIWLLNFSKLNL